MNHESETAVDVRRKSARINSPSYKPVLPPQPIRQRKRKYNYGPFLDLKKCGPGDYERLWLYMQVKSKEGFYSRGPDMDQRTCIMYSGNTFTWEEKTAGTTWIAIRSHIPCVVAMNTMQEGPGLTKPLNHELNHPPAHATGFAVLADMGDESSTFNQRVTKHADNIYHPFAVISVAPGTVGDSDEGVTRAINYLKSVFQAYPPITPKDIKKTGLYALKHLFGPKFVSHEPQMFTYAGLHKACGGGPVRLNNYDDFDNFLTDNSQNCCYDGVTSGTNVKKARHLTPVEPPLAAPTNNHLATGYLPDETNDHVATTELLMNPSDHL